MLAIEVKRHAQGESYFDPWIEDDEDGGCRFHFHHDDISDEGTALLAVLLGQQARRWHPRPPGVPRGPRIPITMKRQDVMDGRSAVEVDDHAGYIRYTVRADLISERGARCITRRQSERSPDWERIPARYLVRLQPA
ncbi:hypothetical protein [Streptomyces antibioticus]|uniref:hypothetical protein n=1 Tax=Streptomyces antibioticus TaxID=1890 RepID=UPI003F4864C6